MDLYIVTVTAVCRIGGVESVDAAKLFHSLSIDDSGIGPIPFAEFATKRVRVSKGVFVVNKNNKLRWEPNGSITNKRAFSSSSGFKFILTMLVRVPSKGYVVNVKVFNNGKLQMTGLKNPEDGTEVANVVSQTLKDAIAKDPEVAIVSKRDISVEDYKVCMINGIFAVPFSIDRQKTHELLLKKQMQSIYDPMLYHAVKLRVPHPNITNKKTSATVAIFQTGSIIITGATTIEEVNDLHVLVKNVLEDNRSLLQRVEWRIVA